MLRACQPSSATVLMVVLSWQAAAASSSSNCLLSQQEAPSWDQQLLLTGSVTASICLFVSACTFHFAGYFSG